MRLSGKARTAQFPSANQLLAMQTCLNSETWSVLCQASDLTSLNKSLLPGVWLVSDILCA